MKYLLLLLCLCLSINGIAQNDRGLDTNAIEAPSTNKPSLEREFRVLKIEEKAKDVFWYMLQGTILHIFQDRSLLLQLKVNGLKCGTNIERDYAIFFFEKIFYPSYWL